MNSKTNYEILTEEFNQFFKPFDGLPPNIDTYNKSKVWVILNHYTTNPVLTSLLTSVGPILDHKSTDLENQMVDRIISENSKYPLSLNCMNLLAQIRVLGSVAIVDEDIKMDILSVIDLLLNKLEELLIEYNDNPDEREWCLVDCADNDLNVRAVVCNDGDWEHKISLECTCIETDRTQTITFGGEWCKETAKRHLKFFESVKDFEIE